MFRLNRMVWTLPVVAALGGCIDSTGPQVAVDLSQSDFTRPTEGPAIVRYTVHNGGDSYAYFSGCASPIPVVLERDNNGTWEDAGEYNTSCPTSGQQLALEPGASHADSISVADAGQFRMNVWFGSSISSPYAYAIRSATFQVH